MLLLVSQQNIAQEDGDGIIEPGEDELAELAKASQSDIACLKKNETRNKPQ